MASLNSSLRPLWPSSSRPPPTSLSTPSTPTPPSPKPSMKPPWAPKAAPFTSDPKDQSCLPARFRYNLRQSSGGRTSMDIDVLVDYDCVCGENPLWHPDEHRLYWTDI